MSGERDLAALLSGMEPVLDDRAWVFCSVAEVPSGVQPVVTVREDEGLTLVVEQRAADDARLTYDYVAARITLRVHSDLAAVGLTAAVATALADAGISCNVVAGYFHDHLYVPHDRGAEAVEVLASLARR